MRRGFLSDDAKLLLAEEVIDHSVLKKFTELKKSGKTSICLFVNNQLLATLPTDSVALHCTDEIDEGIAPCKGNKRAQEHLKQMNKDCNLTAGLEEVIHLATGARVMLRRNLNTEAGLVNVAIGTVITISAVAVSQKFDNINEPYGATTIKSRFCVLKHFYIHRHQFPMTVAYAI